MKSAAFSIFSLALLCAQPLSAQQPPASVVPLAPGTPSIGAPAKAPAAAAEIKPDTIVMEAANGKKYTAAEVEHMIQMLPAQYQGPARSQPQAAVQLLSQVLFFQRLTEEAEKDQVDKQSPYKEQLELARMQILANVELMLHHNTIIVKEEDREKFYKEHPDHFQEAKVRAIEVSFNPTPGKEVPGSKKLLSEAEAKAKIEDLRKQIVGGADFGKLARENSDDATSAGKDGDFGSWKRNSPYPEPIKNAVFALKPGELSQPVRLPAAFWLIRLEDLRTQPYTELGDQIDAEIKQEQFQTWQKSLQTQYTMKVDNPAFFAPKPAPAQLQQVH